MKGHTPYNDLERKILFEHLDKYPSASTRAIARILHRDHPEFFKDFETARSYVRLYRGAIGVKARSELKITKYFKHGLA